MNKIITVSLYLAGDKLMLEEQSKMNRKLSSMSDGRPKNFKTKPSKLSICISRINSNYMSNNNMLSITEEIYSMMRNAQTGGNTLCESMHEEE